MNIVATSGKPGEGFNVNIRGAGTNGNTAPLYVIDGVVGDINSVNPADIESIDVLKDAASSAIYGARAANGVILVTTKQGKIGKVTTSYDGSIGWQNMTRIPKQLTAKQYMDVQDMTNINDGRLLMIGLRLSLLISWLLIRMVLILVLIGWRCFATRMLLQQAIL